MGDNTAAFEDRVKYMTDKVSVSYKTFLCCCYLLQF